MKTLLELMARLRDPKAGCPWNLEQTFETIAPYTLEEAHEVVDAIDRKNPEDLKEELGDLLLQVVFHAQMASEKGLFAFQDVVDTITGKLVRRHPHIFSETDEKCLSAEDVSRNWDRIKAAEKEKDVPEGTSVLEGIADALPSLKKSAILGKRVACVGFDWHTPAQVLAKVDEERQELQAEIDAGAALEPTRDELGDLFFVLAQLARKLGFDPEEAARLGNKKFERRFRFIEDQLRAQGRTCEDATLEEMEALWQEAKRREQPKITTGFA